MIKVSVLANALLKIDFSLSVHLYSVGHAAIGVENGQSFYFLCMKLPEEPDLVPIRKHPDASAG